VASDKPTWKEYRWPPTIHQPGSATGQNTGDWRSERRCATGEVRQVRHLLDLLPDAALFMNEEGFYEVDLYHCKGCKASADGSASKAQSRMVEEGVMGKRTGLEVSLAVSERSS